MGDEERGTGADLIGGMGCEEDRYERDQVGRSGEGLGGECRVAHCLEDGGEEDRER